MAPPPAKGLGLYIARYSADPADGPLRLTNVSFACQKQLTSFASPPVRSKKEIMACLAFKNNLVDNTPLVLSQAVRGIHKCRLYHIHTPYIPYKGCGWRESAAATTHSFPSWRASSVVTCHNKCGSSKRQTKRQPEGRKSAQNVIRN